MNEVHCIESLMIAYESKVLDKLCPSDRNLKLDKIKSTNAHCMMKPKFL